MQIPLSILVTDSILCNTPVYYLEKLTQFDTIGVIDVYTSVQAAQFDTIGQHCNTQTLESKFLHSNLCNVKCNAIQLMLMMIQC